MTTPRRLRATAAVSLLLLVAACARLDDPGPVDAAGAGSDSRSDAADALVLRVEHTGGFVTPEMLATRLPMVSLYGDGVLITDGPQLLIYPPPALPNLQTQRLRPAEVRLLVERARDAGVGATGLDLGQPPIADAATTRFTLATDSGVQTTEAYALGETPETGHGLTAEQVKARKALRDLLSALTDLPTTLNRADAAETTAYKPAALAAVATPWTGDRDAPEQKPIAWPGPTLPGERMGGGDLSCVTVEGDKVDAVLAAAKWATTVTPWTSGGERWTVGLRPLLPDEEGCADLGD